PGRLVDDEEVRVLEDDLQGDLLRGGVGLGALGEPYTDLVPLLDPHARLDPAGEPAVHRDVPLADLSSELGTAVPRESSHEEDVQALAVVAPIGDEAVLEQVQVVQ